MLIPKARILRCPKHLDWVRRQPCLGCGASPCHAHHVKCGFGMIGKRVSDSRTVPLCPDCHRDLHSAGELGWWQERGVLDPQTVTERIWRASPHFSED